MASEGEQQGEQKHRYKLVGTVNPGERVDRLILEGSAANPKRFIDLDNDGEMTEVEAKQAKAEHGVVLRKVGEPEGARPEETGPPKTREEQQKAQAAGVGAPPAEPAPGTSGKR